MKLGIRHSPLGQVAWAASSWPSSGRPPGVLALHPEGRSSQFLVAEFQSDTLTGHVCAIDSVLKQSQVSSSPFSNICKRQGALHKLLNPRPGLARVGAEDAWEEAETPLASPPVIPPRPPGEPVEQPNFQAAGARRSPSLSSDGHVEAAAAGRGKYSIFAGVYGDYDWQEPLFAKAERSVRGPVHRLRKGRRLNRRAGFAAKKLNPAEKTSVIAVQELQARIAALPPGTSPADILSQYEGKEGKLEGQLATILVSSLCEEGRHPQALLVFNWLKSHGRQIAPVAHVDLMSAFARNGPFDEPGRLMAHLPKSGSGPSLLAYNAEMQALSRRGRWRDVVALFGSIRAAGLQPDTVSYNTLLLAYGRARRVDEVVNLWAEMDALAEAEDEGVQVAAPNAGTYSLIISTFVQTGRCQLALEAYWAAMQRRVKGFPSSDVLKGLVCLCSKANRWPLALDFYNEMRALGFQATSVVMFNALITSIARKDKQQERPTWPLAMGVFEELRAAGLTPTVYTWSALLAALGRAGEFDRAMALHQGMLQLGVKPNREVFNAALLVCHRCARWRRGVQFVWEMEAQGIEPDVISYSSLILACEADGEVEVAEEVFRRMKRARCHPNSYVYASMIRAVGKAGDWLRGQEIFEEMRLSGQVANVQVYNALISALACNSQLVAAAQLYGEMRRYGVARDAQTITLAEAYGLGDTAMEETVESEDTGER